MKLHSIYDILKGRIETLPIYKINDVEYTIVPIEITQPNIFTYEENICFQLDSSSRITDISKKDLIKITNKIKKFLINHFDRISEYSEDWESDNIRFSITYFYQGDYK